jgi:hypothetical protein
MQALRLVESVGGIPVGVGAFVGVNLLTSGRAAEMEKLIGAEVFIGFMGAVLTAATLFLFVADQNARDATNKEETATKLHGVGTQIPEPTASQIKTLKSRSNSLFTAAFLFIVGFLYSLAGLIAYLGFEPLLRHEPILTDKEAYSVVSLMSLLRLPPEPGLGITLSWGLLGGATFATTDGAVRTMACITKMLPRNK